MADKFSRERVNGYLRTDGRRIVNGAGETIILQGLGVGNWMNPEGFMIGGVELIDFSLDPKKFALPRRFERGRTMLTTVRELCGTKYAEEFQKRWLENYMTEDDIRVCAELGFNSLRIALSSRLLLDEEPGIHFNEDNFRLLDRLIDWCEKYRVYAILDMHGAPGGQSGLACDDGIDNMLHTYDEPESRARTILLWEEIAKRYAGRWIVGAYDFLNEPISGVGMEDRVDDVRSLYEDIIAGIRKHDKKHMLTLEGEVFSSGTRLFDRDYDPECHNWCIHSHFYGFSPERKDLYRFLDASLRRNVPVWIGEGGSDDISNAVYYDIAASYDIGYSVWVWKSAMDSSGNGPGVLRHRLPENWAPIHAFICEGGPRPSYEESMKVFDEMLSLLSPDKCEINFDKARYLIRKSPMTIPGVCFDDPDESHLSNGWIYGNPFNYRPESRMKMVLRPGKEPPKFHSHLSGPRPADPKEAFNSLCLELREGEFAQYTVRHGSAGHAVKAFLRPVGDGAAIEAAISGGGCARIEISAEGWRELGTLAADGESTLTIKAVSESVQIDTVLFE